jgi:hypothetical protein
VQGNNPTKKKKTGEGGWHYTNEGRAAFFFFLLFETFFAHVETSGDDGDDAVIDGMRGVAVCVRMNGGKATRRAEQWPWFLWRGCARASMCCSMPPSFGAPPPHLVPPHHHHHPLGYKTSVRSLATACLGLRQGHGNISLSLHFFFFFFFSLVLYCKREEKHPPRPTLPPVITFFPVKKEKKRNKL